MDAYLCSLGQKSLLIFREPVKKETRNKETQSGAKICSIQVDVQPKCFCGLSWIGRCLFSSRPHQTIKTYSRPFGDKKNLDRSWFNPKYFIKSTFKNGGGGQNSSEVVCMLLIQCPQIQIPALPRFILLLSLWTVENSNPSSAYASDFVNAVSGKGLSWVPQKTCNLGSVLDAMGRASACGANSLIEHKVVEKKWSQSWWNCMIYWLQVEKSQFLALPSMRTVWESKKKLKNNSKGLCQ